MGWHIVTGPDAGQWVAEQISGTYHFGDTAIALKRGDVFSAGVLYEQWNGRSIMAHIAVRDRITPTFLAAIFHYPFIVCGVHKIICPIPADNARSISLAANMGFAEEARIADAQPTGDILIYTLTKADCRFLGELYLGKIISSPSPSSA